MLRFKAYINEVINVPSKSKTLGIDRKEMPQIDGKHISDFISYLKKEGIDSQKKKVDPSTLKATQHQFHKAKIQNLVDYINDGTYDDKHILVSKDNYVMDGHHRWLAHKETDKKIGIHHIGMNAKDLMQKMHDYPKSYTEKLYEAYSVQYLRDKDVDVLKLKDTKKPSWVEVRGKKNYEVTYDKNDPMHKAIDSLGKAANISDLMNGEIVYINPKHPHGKKAISNIERLMK